jgi:hypothetical protein
VCWRFTGSGSNSCNGDSGGPLLVESPSGPVVAGVTSGGEKDSCLADDSAYDASVAHYAAWIREVGGGDVARATCGGTPRAGEADAPIVAVTATLDGPSPGRVHHVLVPPGTNELRLALNAIDDQRADFDVYVKAGAVPSSSDYDCRASGPSQYGACRFTFPTAGLWYALVQRVYGTGPYQLTATVVGGPPPVCGNGRQETGEECDADDDLACEGACDADCTCLHPCAADDLSALRMRVGDRTVVKAVLRNASGDYDRLDPPATDITLTLDDGTAPVDLVIPAGDPGWDTPSNPRTDLYQWRGRLGVRTVVLRCHRVRNGDWEVGVKLSGRRSLPAVSPR